MVCLLYSQNRLRLSPRHLSRQHLSWGHLSISAISQLLLARFGSNFKQRVLGTYTTDYNCHHDIYPGNICPYQQYLSCHLSDLDQTLKKWSLEHIQQFTTVNTTFVHATFVHISNISISKLNTFDFSLVFFLFLARATIGTSLYVSLRQSVSQCVSVFKTHNVKLKFCVEVVCTS